MNDQVEAFAFGQNRSRVVFDLASITRTEANRDRIARLECEKLPIKRLRGDLMNLEENVIQSGVFVWIGHALGIDHRGGHVRTAEIDADRRRHYFAAAGTVTTFVGSSYREKLIVKPSFLHTPTRYVALS